MKKALILYSGARTWGGVETYLFDLISFPNEEVEFQIASLGEWDFTEKVEGKVPVKFFSKARLNLNLPFSLGSFCKKNDISVIVSQGVVSNFYSRLVSLTYRIPNICIVHSELAGEYHNPIIRNTYLFSDFLLKCIPKRYITVSKYLKEILFNRGIPASKIDVIYNGIREVKRIENREKRDKVIIGSVGRLEKEKGYDLLIKAANDIKGDFEINIYGEGRQERVLQEMIDEIDLSDKVKLKGFSNDIDKEYEKMDLYIQPSRSEGFGLSLVKAMSYGIPVIVSNRGSFPELLTGYNGQILENLDQESITKILNQSFKNISELKEKAYLGREEIFNKFDFKKWGEKTIKVILETAK